MSKGHYLHASRFKTPLVHLYLYSLSARLHLPVYAARATETILSKSKSNLKQNPFFSSFKKNDEKLKLS